MLNARVPVEEAYHNFLRPTIHESIRRILEFYGLKGVAQIYYNGENEISDLVGANQSDPIYSSNYTDMLFRNKLFIVPEITHSEFNTGYANQRRSATEQPVWKGDNNFTITPDFSGIKVEVTVAGHFNSRKTAEQFVNQLNRVRDEAVTDINFSANVHLLLNTPILKLLTNVYELTKKWDSTTPATFAEWFYARATRPFTTIMNEVGNHKRIVTPMLINNIGLYFSDPVVQLARKTEAFGRYEVEFRYFFFFQRHTHWKLEYPLNVYQDQIEDKWIGRPDPQFAKRFDVNVHPEWANMAPFTMERSSSSPYYLKLPDYDPWAMPKQAWIQVIVQARLAVENVPSQVLLNVFDLPGFVWNEQVKAYILRRKSVAFLHHETPFLIKVYSNDIQVDPFDLTMSDTGDITLTRLPHMENTYRVMVLLDYAVRDYSQEIWNDLWNNEADQNLIPEVFSWYDFTKLPQPWIDHVDQVLADIDKGTGLALPGYGRYMMGLGLTAYNLLEYKPNGPR